MDPIEFVDECTVYARGGNGGNGSAAMRRESHVPLGGPAGGDGGDGGDVVFVADTNTTSLLDLHRRPHRRAENGVHGEGMQKTGRDGEDLVIHVPIGTVIRAHGTDKVLADLTKPGQRFIAAAGGRHGRGNLRFVNRHRRAPMFAEYGEKVEDRVLRLELKLIADVGLVGFPSAGKSSLIAHMSKAKPKIAAYPFTTLTPNLGVVRAGGTDYVMADVPGLVPGASEGKGLGHQFLRHVERCSVLLHVLDTSPFESDRDPVTDLDALILELEQHDEALAARPSLIALNKIDSPDGAEMANLVRDTLTERGFEVFEVSAVTGEGLETMSYRIAQMVDEARKQRLLDAEDDDAVDPDDELVITLRRKGPTFTIEYNAEENIYVVSSKQFERWMQMLPMANPEAADYLQSRLRRAGLEAGLIEAGAREGDDVAISDIVFEFTPELADLPKEERDAIIAAEMAEDARAEAGAPEAWEDDDWESEDEVDV